MGALTLSTLLFFISAASFAQSALHRGENLLQPMPIPGEGWEMSRRDDAESRSVRWSHPTSGESLTTTISSGGRMSTARFREINDSTGRRHCKEFSTTTLREGETNGFQREIWLAQCDQEDSNDFTLLHQFIAGRDSTYYLVKRWSEYPNETELDSWVEYFETISVCDTRPRRRAPCPELVDANGN